MRRLYMTVGPVVGLALIFAATGVLLDRDAMLFLGGMLVGAFVGGGKLVILGGAVETAPLSAWQVAGLVVYSDLATASIVMANMPFLYRMPGVGQRLADLRTASFQVMKSHGWMRRFAFLGAAVFIALPFQGTGAILGVLAGRVLGLSRWGVLGATLLGSAVGSVIIATAGSLVSAHITNLTRSPLLGLTVAALMLAGAYVFGRSFLAMPVTRPAESDGDS
jgi:uncharacterized membrane protein